MLISNQGITIDERVPRKGDMWFVDLGSPSAPGVQSKPRPCLVCQPREGENNSIIYVAPASTALKNPAPFLQDLYVRKPSQLHYENIRPVNKRNFHNYMGRLSFKEFMAMDIHMPVPLGLTRSSFMHMNGIKSIDLTVNEDPMKSIYSVLIERLFSMDRVYFTPNHIVEHFGPEGLSILDRPLDSLREFFETLQGMKFLYLLELRVEYDE